MEKDRIIEKLTSEWASHIAVATKEDTNILICIE